MKRILDIILAGLLIIVATIALPFALLGFWALAAAGRLTGDE